MEVKYVKSSPFLYLNRIHIATFLPFRAYNTDNQLIIDSINVSIIKDTINASIFIAVNEKIHHISQQACNALLGSELEAGR